MMHTYDDILKQTEGKTLEFKRDLSSPTPLLRTLTAFANSAGGRLVVGVDDDRNVSGVDDPLDAEERLCSMVADTIAPRLVPNIELITIESKTLLVVEVFLSGMRPHYLKRKGLENGVYVRLGSTNRQADGPLIAELQRGVAGIGSSRAMGQRHPRDLSRSGGKQAARTADRRDCRTGALYCAVAKVATLVSGTITQNDLKGADGPQSQSWGPVTARVSARVAARVRAEAFAQSSGGE